MKQALETGAHPWSRFPLALIPVLVLMAGCGVDSNEAELTEQQGSDVEQVSSALCPSYVPEIAEARRLIGLNCGAIASGCGGRDRTDHNDLQLTGGTGSMCSCYSYMWNNRGVYPWTALQVIYHPPASCGSFPHLHLEKRNTCGQMHFDLDGSPDDVDCYNSDSGAAIDKTFCNTGSLKSSCGGGSSGGWSCATSAYNGVQYWTCNGGNRTRCDASGRPVTETCQAGCYSRPAGYNDICIARTTGWSCSNSAYGSQQLWTCSNGDLYKCDSSGAIKVDCPSGCNVMALGTNDTCK